MARRRKKQKDDPIQTLVGLLTIVGGIISLIISKSFLVALFVAGGIIGFYSWIVLSINWKKAERLKRSGIAEIDKMDGRKFELYLSYLFKAHG